MRVKYHNNNLFLTLQQGNWGNTNSVRMQSKCYLVSLKSTKAWKKICCVLAGWTDGKLTVSLSAFAKEEDQQLPDEPYPDNEEEKEKPRQTVSCS